MAREYHLIYTRLWKTAWFRALSPDAKLVFLNLRTSEAANVACLIYVYSDQVVEDTALSRERVAAALDEILRLAPVRREGNLARRSGYEMTSPDGPASQWGEIEMTDEGLMEQRRFLGRIEAGDVVAYPIERAEAEAKQIYGEHTKLWDRCFSPRHVLEDRPYFTTQHQGRPQTRPTNWATIDDVAEQFQQWRERRRRAWQEDVYRRMLELIRQWRRAAARQRHEGEPARTPEYEVLDHRPLALSEPRRLLPLPRRKPCIRGDSGSAGAQVRGDEAQQTRA